MISQNRILFSFLIALFLFILLYLVFGFHYDTLDDTYRIGFMRGTFYKTKVDTFFIYMIGFSEIWVWLYLKFPEMEWYSITTLLILFFSCWVIMYSLIKMMEPSGIKNGILIIFSILFFILLLDEFIVGWQWSKTAAICIVAGLILNHTNSFMNRYKLNWLKIVISGILILIGILFRYESALMLFLMYSIYIIIFKLNIRLLISPSIVAIPFFIIYLFAKFISPSQDRINFNIIEPYIFQYHDAGSIKCNIPEFISDEDEIKRAAFNNWFFTHKETIDSDFLTTYYTKNIFSKCNTEIVIKKLNYQWKEYGYYVTNEIKYLHLLWLFLFISTLTIGNKIQNFQLIVFNLSAFIMMFSIAVLIKLEKRHIMSLLLLFNVLNFHQFSLRLMNNEILIKVRKFILIIGIAIFSTFIFSNLNYLKAYSENKRMDEEYCREFRNSLSSFSEKVLVPDIWTILTLIYGKPFEKIDFPQGSDILIYDSSYGIFYNDIRNELTGKVGSETFIDFSKYLISNRDSIVLIADNQRIQLIKQYVESIYHFKFDFKEEYTNGMIVNSEKNCMKRKFGYYTLTN